MLTDKTVYVVMRNDWERQELRGIFLTEEGARNWIKKDIDHSDGEWSWVDFVILEEDLQE